MVWLLIGTCKFYFQNFNELPSRRDCFSLEETSTYHMDIQTAHWNQLLGLSVITGKENRRKLGTVEQGIMELAWFGCLESYSQRF